MKKIIYKNKYIAIFAVTVGLSKLISQLVIGFSTEKEKTKHVENSKDNEYNG